jgi:hypothetical protein
MLSIQYIHTEYAVQRKVEILFIPETYKNYQKGTVRDQLTDFGRWRGEIDC